MSPESYISVFKTLLSFSLLGTVVATVGLFYYSSQVNTARIHKITELIKGRNVVVAQKDELLKKLETFEADLKRKNEHIEELEEQSVNLRLAATNYDFFGIKRAETIKNVKAIPGEENLVFEKLKQLEQQEHYEDVINLASQQIAKTPGWLTPYLFRGAALVNLGRKNDAFADLQFVAQHSDNDQTYAIATQLLEKIKTEATSAAK